MGKGQRLAVTTMSAPLNSGDTIKKVPSLPTGTSLFPHKSAYKAAEMEEAPLFTLVTTYISYFILILFGHVRDICGNIFSPSDYTHLKQVDGYAPINSGFGTIASFFLSLRYFLSPPIICANSRLLQSPNH
jgi:serine palmitoyltransferase